MSTGNVQVQFPDGLTLVRWGSPEAENEFVFDGGSILSTGTGPVVRLEPGYSRVYDIMRDSWVITKNLPQPQDVTFRYRARTQFDLDGLQAAAERQKSYPPLVEVTGLD